MQHQTLSIGCQINLVSVLNIPCPFDDDIGMRFEYAEYLFIRRNDNVFINPLLRLVNNFTQQAAIVKCSFTPYHLTNPVLHSVISQCTQRSIDLLENDKSAGYQLRIKRLFFSLFCVEDRKPKSLGFVSLIGEANPQTGMPVTGTQLAAQHTNAVIEQLTIAWWCYVCLNNGGVYTYLGIINVPLLIPFGAQQFMNRLKCVRADFSNARLQPGTAWKLVV